MTKINRLLKSFSFCTRCCIAVIFIYFIAAIYGEFTFQYFQIQGETAPYNAVNMEARYLPPLSTVVLPSGEEHTYWLGSDNLGRDVAMRLIQGTRIAFHVGIVTSLLAVPFGALLGLLAGYYRGWVDSLCTWLATTIAAIPALLLILAISIVVVSQQFNCSSSHLLSFSL